MYLTGPKVIKEVTGEVVTTSELGGAEVHMNNSGVAHFVYPDDESCLEGVKRLLSYLPENFEEKAPYVEPVKNITTRDFVILYHLIQRCLMICMR